MEMNENQHPLLEPIEEDERVMLQNKLVEQRLELEEKKRYLEELKRKNDLGNDTTTDITNVDELPDPDKMLQEFLESLEKGDQSMKDLMFLKDNKNIMNGNEPHSQLLQDLTNSHGVSTEAFYHPMTGTSIDEITDAHNLFKKTPASLTNFNFKINKCTASTKVINIEAKNVNQFHKSVQVDLLEESEGILKKGGTKKTQLQKVKSKSGKKKTTDKTKQTDSSKTDSMDKQEEEEEKEEEEEEDDEEVDEEGKRGKKEKGKAKKEHVELREEEKNYILKSPQFVKFIEQSSKMVERTLGEHEMFHSMFDFVSKDLSDTSESTEKLKILNTYYCKKYTNSRPITDVRTSNVYSDLFLASYGISEKASSLDPDGCVLVWNTTMNSRPEYTFTYQSAVCTALFNKFNPHLIIGGTYTGNVVIWDMRVNKKPVLKTLISSYSHLHPIYCAEVIGTQNAHNLVTADTDGRLCKWSLNMFTSPSDTVDFKKGNKELSCCCFSFQEGEINTLYGGSEDGSLFQAQIHGSKVGATEFYNIHEGPITSTQFHPLIEGTNDHNDIILSASVDWTCKLLSIKNPTEPLITLDAFEDYIMDVKWSPTHPGIFATCGCNGNVVLWNFANELEFPYYEMNVSDKSLNKIAWSCEGKKLITGDSDGCITLWNATNDVYQPKSDDIDIFEEAIAKKKSEHIVMDELK